MRVVGGVDMERERVTHPACASSASDASSVRMHVEGVRVRVGIEGMHVDMEVHGGVEAWAGCTDAEEDKGGMERISVSELRVWVWGMGVGHGCGCGAWAWGMGMGVGHGHGQYPAWGINACREHRCGDSVGKCVSSERDGEARAWAWVQGVSILTTSP
ncbi:hypothetical protein DFH94DRAFT_680228 [Russula ochroleuca]|uniref:Uncharacterized protein n=1 Tax=Russula ochroleuca TaxID=152965 RepID=A0A9P5N1B0_9AGAM|nr:hypothetical protein DFH94DRAFT_680228 [Russula ochroleuca]